MEKGRPGEAPEPINAAEYERLRDHIDVRWKEALRESRQAARSIRVSGSTTEIHELSALLDRENDVIGEFVILLSRARASGIYIGDRPYRRCRECGEVYAAGNGHAGLCPSCVDLRGGEGSTSADDPEFLAIGEAVDRGETLISCGEHHTIQVVDDIDRGTWEYHLLDSKGRLIMAPQADLELIYELVMDLRSGIEHPDARSS